MIEAAARARRGLHVRDAVVVLRIRSQPLGEEPVELALPLPLGDALRIPRRMCEQLGIDLAQARATERVRELLVQPPTRRQPVPEPERMVAHLHLVLDAA